MLTITKIAGFIGAALAGAAYVPQIWHLARERCSAGISRSAFSVWLGASVLLTAHATVTHAAVFVLLGILQIGAITTILFYATKYRSSYCAGHAPRLVEHRKRNEPRRPMGPRAGVPVTT